MSVYLSSMPWPLAPPNSPASGASVLKNGKGLSTSPVKNKIELLVESNRHGERVPSNSPATGCSILETKDLLSSSPVKRKIDLWIRDNQPENDVTKVVDENSKLESLSEWVMELDI